MYFVYILESLKDHNLYTGYTFDLANRLKAHNSGKVKSTQKRRPFELVYHEEAATLAQARRREGKLKSLRGGVVKRELVNNFNARP